MNLWFNRSFEKKTYPIFLEQLDMAFKDNKAVILWNAYDEYFNAIVCINHHFIYIKKHKNQILIIEHYDLPKVLDNAYQWSAKEFDFEEFKNLVMDMKIQATTVASTNIIEFLSNQLKNVGKYYHFSRAQLEQVFNAIVIKNMEFFSANPPALVIENKNIDNKWID